MDGRDAVDAAYIRRFDRRRARKHSQLLSRGDVYLYISQLRSLIFPISKLPSVARWTTLGTSHFAPMLPYPHPGPTVAKLGPS